MSIRGSKPCATAEAYALATTCEERFFLLLAPSAFLICSSLHAVISRISVVSSFLPKYYKAPFFNNQKLACVYHEFLISFIMV